MGDVLHLIETNQNRILNFKRTQAYTIEDFDLLYRLWLSSGP